MSTLKSKTRAAERHRRAVAVELLSAGCVRWTRADMPHVPECSGHVGLLLSADHQVAIDVHAAREHAKTLVALADEQAVFEDWTRAKGLGPENREPGAFDPCTGCVWCAGMEGRCLIGERDGGWPGKLAREWPGDSRAPMGRSLARLGQRILDMLEGQPSTCQGCSGRGTKDSGPLSFDRLMDGTSLSWEAMFPGPCEDCHGTGHNLAGKLPAQEWSPAVWRRKCEMRDADAGLRANVYQPQWLDRIVGSTNREFATVTENRVHGVGFKRLAHVERQVAAGTFEPGLMSLTLRRTETRVCPRGEHRASEGERAWGFTGMRAEHDIGGYKAGERVRVRGYGKGRWRPRTTHDKPVHACTPRWRRGEIEHAHQQRGREARRTREHPVIRRARGVPETARFAVLGETAFRQLSQAMEANLPIGEMVPGLPEGTWFVESMQMRQGDLPVTDVTAFRAEPWSPAA